MLKEIFLIMNFALSTNTNLYSFGTPEKSVILEEEGISLASSESHPTVEGMRYWGGYDRSKAIDVSSGYCYYDLNVYYADFTDVSRLYLINVKADFTSGWIACQNKKSGYSDMYDLDTGYAHISPIDKFSNNGDTSSSIKRLSTWPSSSTSVSSVSSGYSSNYSTNWQNGAKLSWPNGVEVTLQRSNGLSLQINHSMTISTDEPYVSSQTDPDKKLAQQWNYTYKGLGKATYTLDLFYLLEVKNDSVGFNKYGFVFDIYLNMSNVKFKSWWWESHDSQDYSMRVYLGLGRNPSA